jgi:hypothetical protein
MTAPARTLNDAADNAIKLLERANARHSAITGTELFKSNPEFVEARAKASEPCADMDSFGGFIDAVYLFFYKGSGDGTRIQAFSAVPEFAADVKALWSFRDDMKKGRMKEASQKMAEVNGIFEKYTGKKPDALVADDFLSMQIRILDKMAEFFKFLMR